jgi:replicative DNA helicase
MDSESQSKLEQITALDIHNEQLAIGYMLQDEQTAISATKMLQEKYFSMEYGSHIFKILKSSIEKGDSVHNVRIKVNSITDKDWKELAPQYNTNRKDFLNDCYTLALPFLGLVSIAEGVFKRIQEQYLRRIMLATYQDSIKKLLNSSDVNDLDGIVNEVNKKSNVTLDGMISVKAKTYKEQGMVVLNQKEQATISTGFSKLDEIIKGLKAGQLITIGAGTGVGKSAFAVNLALNITKQGHKVGLWSFEMDIQEIFQRIFSVVTGISEDAKSQKEERYNKAREYLDNTKDDIGVYLEPIRDISNFYLLCRQLSVQNKVKVIIIDYLQLIHLPSDFNKNRVSELEEITKKLKNMANELGITIIILSQLSRAYQKRDDKTPMLSDLRDSGSIEQDSNIVILLHRPEIQPSHYSIFEHCIELIVAKNRSGLSGSFFLKYLRNTTKFTEALK